jgi:hypothetical protein
VGEWPEGVAVIAGIDLPEELVEELFAMEGQPFPEIVLKLADIFERIGHADWSARLRESRFDSDRILAILDEMDAQQ